MTSKSVVAVLLLAAAAFPAGAQASLDSLTRISGVTPFPNGCPGVASGQTPSSEAEPAVAFDPRDPNLVTAVFQQDRFPVDGGAIANLAAVSSDGGRSFSQVIPPKVSRCTGGVHERASDPWISYGPDGTAYAAHLTFDENPELAAGGLAGPTALSSQTSSDGGKTWNDPVKIVDDNIYDDREALKADPFKPGVAYVAWVRRLGSFGENGQMMFAKTVDGGQSWSTGQLVYSPGPLKLPDPILIEVMPDGTLVASFVIINAAYAVSSAPVSFDIDSVRSTDGGATWSAPVKIATTVSTTPRDEDSGSEIRSLPIVTTAQVGGTIYAAWNEIRSKSESVLQLSSTSDGGETWSKPALVAKIAGQAFLPALAAEPDGTLGLLWDDTRHDKPGDKQLTTDVWVGTSVDHGASWGQTHVSGPFDALSASETSSTKVAGHFLGDYQGLVALPGAFGAVFAASKPTAVDGPSDIFFARVKPKAGVPALAVRLSPAVVRAGRRTRLKVTVTSAGTVVAGATVRIGHTLLRTPRSGVVRAAIRLRRAGRVAVAARKKGYRSRRAYVRVRG
jgi:hypothetical protein